MSLIGIIRTAIIANTVRSYQFDEISEKAGCSRHVAKQLYYAFIYRAPEDFLQGLLKGGE